MALVNPTAPAPLTAPSALRFASTLFATTLFLSAFLLFLIQPMFTKLVLPRLGGAPTVWSVAMVFFQATLLAGYAYAHLMIRRLSPAVGALAHLGVLAAAALTLPISITEILGPQPHGSIALWLIAVFALSIGLPFAALSASAPLLQGWFAATGHPRAGNPYILYAASNLGSFAALIAYPVLVEPTLSLKDQMRLWSVGFAVLALLIAVTSLFAMPQPKIGRSDSAAESVPMRSRAIWIAQAAVPAGLVIAVTSYITTDIASAPFLWVLPLALYLLTFVMAFRDQPIISVRTVARLVPILVAPLSISLLGGDKLFWLATMLVNLAAFLLLALMCHAQLYRGRPAPAHLTDFYLCVSLGGVIGGIFAALAAPYIFNRIYEYPILLLAGLLMTPGMFAEGLRRALIEAAPILAVIALAVAAQVAFGVHLPAAAELPFQIALVAFTVVMLLQRHRPARFLALAALGFVVTGLWRPGFHQIETVRSFYGVHQVVETADSRYRLLYHGTTLHGAEAIGPTETPLPEPITYYYFGGPISESIAAARVASGGTLRRVAVIGLGAGSLACHARGAEEWTFFEIDPSVVQIARNPRLFKFIPSCKPEVAVVLGDARLTIAASPYQYDLIVLDAFSSDAVPVHLLTQEALAIYLAHLAPNGVLVFHISNRHMELARVVTASGAASGLLTYVKEDHRPELAANEFKMSALVAALARRVQDFGDLLSQPGWQEARPDPSVSPWTDDYANVFGAILRKKLGW